jgi:hypothetical protein
MIALSSSFPSSSEHTGRSHSLPAYLSCICDCNQTAIAAPTAIVDRTLRDPRKLRARTGPSRDGRGIGHGRAVAGLSTSTRALRRPRFPSPGRPGCRPLPTCTTSRWTRRCTLRSAHTTRSCSLASSGCSPSSVLRSSRRVCSVTRRGLRSTSAVRRGPLREEGCEG